MTTEIQKQKERERRVFVEKQIRLSSADQKTLERIMLEFQAIFNRSTLTKKQK